MSIFGWSYPPGAASDPYAPYNAQDPATELTDLVKSRPPNVTAVWWTVEGDILETVPFTVPASVSLDPCPNPNCTFGYVTLPSGAVIDCPTCGGTAMGEGGTLVPEYTDASEHRTGATCEWDDELTDEQNREAAARAYDAWRSAQPTGEPS